jgi:hypothetical protein
MCCGEKRWAQRATLPAVTTRPTAPTVRQNVLSVARPSSSTQPVPTPAQAPYPSVSLRYLESSPIRVRGPVTGQQYEFSGSRPVQAVDPRDAPALLRTRFFGQR